MGSLLHLLLLHMFVVWVTFSLDMDLNIGLAGSALLRQITLIVNKTDGCVVNIPVVEA